MHYICWPTRPLRNLTFTDLLFVKQNIPLKNHSHYRQIKSNTIRTILSISFMLWISGWTKPLHAATKPHLKKNASQNRFKRINPHPGNPLTNRFDKMLATREMNEIKNLPANQVRAHRTAELVYGPIPSHAKRVSAIVKIDPKITRQHSTGYYAVPGEIVTITVPKHIINQGYQIRINNHVDNLSRTKRWNRMPFGISRTFPINQTTIKIANAFGGAIYIDTGKKPNHRLGKFHVKIKNAIKAPYFVLGKTTDKQWNQRIRNYPAPYAELVSGRIAISVPSKFIRQLKRPTQLIKYWDKVVQVQDYVNNTEKYRTNAERINIDVQISVGALHAGYPIQGPTRSSQGLLNIDKLKTQGNWGYFHELGHEAQRRPDKPRGWGYGKPYTFNRGTEVTVNIFSNVALETMVPNLAATDRWNHSAHPDVVMQRVQKQVAKSSTFKDKNPYPYYFQLADAFGWDTYRKVFGSYHRQHEKKPESMPKTNQEKIDQWFIRFSKASGHDLSKYMIQYWQFPISHSARAKVRKMNLPAWLPIQTKLLKPLPATINKPILIDLQSNAMSLDGINRIQKVKTNHGKITNLGNGKYRFTPRQKGTTTITYQIKSSAGNTKTFKLKVNTTR